jgi:hypothetical protein
MNLGNSLSLTRTSYQDPFLDFSTLALPKNRLKMLELCRTVAMTHPQISPIVKKLALYPLEKKISYRSSKSEEEVRRKWDETFNKHIRIQDVCAQVGIDFFTYGMAYLIPYLPFQRIYKCSACGEGHDASVAKIPYVIQGTDFVGKCPRCKRTAKLIPSDERIEDASRLRFISLDPADVITRRNTYSGRSRHTITPNMQLRAALRGPQYDRVMIDETPLPFVLASLHKRKVDVQAGAILHLREMAPSGVQDEYGLPRILSALKLVYLDQVYKKSDEAGALERTLPARFVYPQATSKDPISSMGLAKFTRYLSFSIKRWRQDRNAIMPVPFPIGVAELGGDAQQHNTSAQRNVTRQEIIGAMGVPEGFLSDGMTWSGGSVQLRFLENMLRGYLRALNDVVEFVEDYTARLIKLPKQDAYLKSFRMADDIQRTSILQSLAQGRIVPWQAVLDSLDLDFYESNEQVRDEDETLKHTRIAQARAEMEAALAAVKAQTMQQGWQQGYTDQDQAQVQQAQAYEQAITQGRAVGEVEQEQQQQQQQAQEEQSAQEQQQQQMQTQMQQAQVQRLSGQAAQASGAAQREVAQAGKLQEHAEFYQEAQDERFIDKTQTAVDVYVNRALGAPTQEARNRVLAEVKQTSPEMFELVMQRISDDVSGVGSGGGEARGTTKERGRAMLEEIRSHAKSVDALRKRVLVLRPGDRLAVIEAMQEEDPMLAYQIMSAMNPATRSQAPSSASLKPANPVRPPKL